MTADILDRLQSALADRYLIERELGHGGNAVVYLAHDQKHDRKVAVKVLLPELALSVRTERFLREIGIAAKLSHPHILPLYDSGAAEGLLYYVMPYVAGESLRDRLRREKQLPVEEAIRITREVAEVLSYAHREGVVHRDIKPENILLAEGHAVVADFGIARALTVAGGQTVTQTGVAVGTPAYMSPEQAGGSGEVDGRSDLYSLGCVLYEMLAGHPPFAGGTAQEVLARHALDPVPSLRAARSDVPEALERVITKALAKQPVGRFPTATEFAAALTATPPRRPSVFASKRRLLYASLALVLLAGSALAARTLLVAARPVERSVAVLPLVNLSGDPDNEYLSDGMTEELINALVQLPGLRVPARTSSFFFKGKDLSLRQIGDSLHVATVLEGSLRKAGNTLRITAQLVKVADGYHLWSQTYDRDLADVRDVLAVQEEIAQAIVRALQVQLGSGAGTTLARRPTEDLEAYDLYLKGRFFLSKGTEEGLGKAVEHFGAAINRDSTFALAYAGLTDAYTERLRFRYASREQALRQARPAALQALALDSTLADAHAALGRVLEYEWDWDGAERAFARAIALNPTYAAAHLRYGHMLVARGRAEAGIREALRAQQLDPLSPAVAAIVSRIYIYAREYDRAIEQARKTLELEPASIDGRQLLGEAHLQQGRYQQAIGEFRTLLEQLGGRGRVAQILARLGYAYARAGNRAEALALLAQMRARSHDLGYALSVAILYTGLGDSDRAFQALEQAYAESDFSLRTTITWMPYFDPLRADPRFARLVKRLGVDE